MSLPDNARELFDDEDGNALENTRIIAAKLVGKNKRTLRLDLTDDVNGTFCVTVTGALASYFEHEGERLRTSSPATADLHSLVELEFDFDEPIGAGADPYGRPDPQEHPEAWTE